MKWRYGGIRIFHGFLGRIQIFHLNLIVFFKFRELESTTEEYRLLEQMNRVTLTKYSDMHQITENISKYVKMNHLSVNSNSHYCETLAVKCEM